jgi:hypothetical protein
VAILALFAAALPARAFLAEYQLTEAGRKFTFIVGATPQWTLDDGAGGVYEGVMDSANFSGAFGLKFKDKEQITRNGDPVEAELMGDIPKSCDVEHVKIELKDKTNDRKITIKGSDGSAFSCESPE